MACYHPIPAYQLGDEPPRLNPPIGTANLQLPCGKCLGCRQAHATQWAHRCDHEARTWQHNSFLTLTYDDEHLPEEGHLSPRDLQLFIKRLRKYAHSNRSDIDRDRGSSVRYFACGEYGEQLQRPHYHLLLFNAGFSDTHAVTGEYYESDALRALWPLGKHWVAPAQPGGAAGYIAKYALKGNRRSGIVDHDGVWKPPPFLRMSTRPAIGHQWMQRYTAELQHGYIVQNGSKQPIPTYYKRKLRDSSKYGDLHEQMVWRLYQNAQRNFSAENQSPARLEAQERIHSRLKQLQAQRKF